MHQYSSVQQVKQRIDVLQMEFECCGDDGYSDWFHVSWVPVDILVAPPEELKL